MQIQWYPGHMKKTRDLISANIKLVDIVVELLDARAPFSSTNPIFNDLIGKKPRLVVLNKCDLADPNINSAWEEYFHRKASVLLYNAKNDSPKKLLQAMQQTGKFVKEKCLAKSQKPRPIRSMIIGVPNVGKSSLINRLVGKAATKTGNKPGVTKGKQWIRLLNDIDLFDTPGILWPKFENQVQAIHLALIGSINDDILDKNELTHYFIPFLQRKYPDVLMERFGDLGDDPLVAIARKRGCLLPGGKVDTDRAANLLIDDYRAGLLGRISLEEPNN